MEDWAGTYQGTYHVILPERMERDQASSLVGGRRFNHWGRTMLQNLILENVGEETAQETSQQARVLHEQAANIVKNFEPISINPNESLERQVQNFLNLYPWLNDLLQKLSEERSENFRQIEEASETAAVERAYKRLQRAPLFLTVGFG